MRLTLALCFVAALGLNGCATSTFTHGKDFSTENVSKIEKGATTSEQLVSLFGQPFSKTVLSATSEKWMYVYTESTAEAQHKVFSVDVKSTGSQKVLDVLVEDGIVANFTFTDQPLVSSTTMQ